MVILLLISACFVCFWEGLVNAFIYRQLSFPIVLLHTRANIIQLNYIRQFVYGAFPLHGTVRFSTARYGTAQFGSICVSTAWYGTVRLSSGRFAFPLHFFTAFEWAGLFTRRYSCAAVTSS